MITNILYFRIRLPALLFPRISRNLCVKLRNSARYRRIVRARVDERKHSGDRRLV